MEADYDPQLLTEIRAALAYLGYTIREPEATHNTRRGLIGWVVVYEPTIGKRGTVGKGVGKTPNAALADALNRVREHS